jgi:hypothetical protein
MGVKQWNRISNQALMENLHPSVDNNTITFVHLELGFYTCSFMMLSVEGAKLMEANSQQSTGNTFAFYFLYFLLASLVLLSYTNKLLW